MKLIEQLKEKTIKYLLSSIFALAILLIGSIYDETILGILPEVIHKLPKVLLLKITALATLLCILLFVLSAFLISKLSNRLFPKFGILWDKNKEPYCPACEKPLSQYAKYDIPNKGFYNAFRCVKCDTQIILTDNCEHIALKDAKNRL